MEHHGPIQFKGAELREARRGNFSPIEKRVRKELPARARFYEKTGRPRGAAEIKRLTR